MERRYKSDSFEAQRMDTPGRRAFRDRVMRKRAFPFWYKRQVRWDQYGRRHHRHVVRWWATPLRWFGLAGQPSRLKGLKRRKPDDPLPATPEMKAASAAACELIERHKHGVHG